MLAVPTPPATTALTTVAAVRAELKLGVENHDPALTRLIADATAAIEQRLDRVCARQKLRETLPGADDTLLQLAMPPVVPFRVTHRGEVVVDYEVEDARAGHLYREAGWETRDAVRSFLAQSPIPGQGPRDWAVEYFSGWFLPGDDYTAATISAQAATKTLTDGAAAFPPLLAPGDVIELVSDASVNHGRRTVVSASPSEIVVQESLADESAGAPITLRVRTLPRDIERACIETATAWWAAAGRDPGIASKRVADVTINYRDEAATGAGVGHLPPRVLWLLTPWVRT